VETEENERSKLSFDLHDELGPCLSALKMSFASLANQNHYSKKKEVMATMGRIIEEALVNLKCFTRNLGSGDYSLRSVSDRIQNLVDNSNQTGRINIVFEKSGTDKEYDVAFATSLYRIVLEIINNGIKHANARQLRINISFGSENVDIHYEDDGSGFDFESSLKCTRGIGLRSIINRIKHYRGSYDFYRREPNGTMIRISLPVDC
jgi:signal transduction histidine kinase